MKKYILYMLIFDLCFLNIKCAPDMDSEPPKSDDNYPGKMVAISVKEFKTNLPLQDVKVTTYYCDAYDSEFGNCTTSIPVSTCMTDYNGICNCWFSNDSFNGVSIEKSMYWSNHLKSHGNYEYIIQPQAWVDVHFISNTEYPSTSTFFVTIHGELRNQNHYIQPINTPNKILTLFGNEENKVDWVLYKTFNSSSEILNSGSFILSPKKFENLTYNLTY